MQSQTWDGLWRGKESQILWSRPDNDVLALMPRLDQEGVHRVLELGCGIGRHVVLMAASGFETHGLDISEYAIEHCNKLYLTLNSTRNSHFGIGSEIEPGTFDNPEKIDGQHLHHYSDEDDVRDLLLNWQIETMKESEQGLTGEPFPGSWHWIVLARNSRTSTYDERIHVDRQDAQGYGASPNRL